MFKNYLVTAWRNLLKNKVFTAINVTGLVVGFAVYVFASLLVTYERSHDTFFEKHERIYTVGTVASPTAEIGVGEIDAAYSAVGPLIEAEVPEVEAVARTVLREYLLTVGDQSYYQNVRFADPTLFEIFDFTYLEGDSSALRNPLGMVMTQSTARRYFGEPPYLGRSVTLDHDHSLQVTAVVADLPLDSHFNSSLVLENAFEVVAPLKALNTIAGYPLEGNTSELSLGNLTYVLLPLERTIDWLQLQMDGIYDRHMDKGDVQSLLVAFKVRPIVENNTFLWYAVALPVIETIHLLGFLVLVVAIVNYTNLATAQSLGRAREVGLRKTLGAKRQQLLAQFLTESLVMAVLAMFVALAIIELSIPTFNALLNKALVIDYVETLPWLLTTTLGVGIIAGLYPAYVITRTTPIDALHNTSGRGSGGHRFRSWLLGLQFTISIFMLSMVLVLYLQNAMLESSSRIFPRSEILTLKRLGLETIRDRLETLRQELHKLDQVEHVAFSSQVPFQQSNNNMSLRRAGAPETEEVMVNQVHIDREFMQAYAIPVVAGRYLGEELAEDTLRDVEDGEEAAAVNIIVNELAASRLGFESPQAALMQSLVNDPEDTVQREYRIVGVMPDRNFLGFHNKIKPFIFLQRPRSMQYASIRVTAKDMRGTLAGVERVWASLVPEYPVQTEFLDETFQSVFRIFASMNQVLAGFAFLALTLSLIGLFGLAAFMAASRTKEIGIRKVMGANLAQITRMLIWQFSRPVLWSLLVALPLSFFAADVYLSFFADRLDYALAVNVGAGIICVVLSWVIVAGHAVTIGRESPIKALRYE